MGKEPSLIVEEKSGMLMRLRDIVWSSNWLERSMIWEFENETQEFNTEARNSGIQYWGSLIEFVAYKMFFNKHLYK